LWVDFPAFSQVCEVIWINSFAAFRAIDRAPETPAESRASRALEEGAFRDPRECWVRRGHLIFVSWFTTAG